MDRKDKNPRERTTLRMKDKADKRRSEQYERGKLLDLTKAGIVYLDQRNPRNSYIDTDELQRAYEAGQIDKEAVRIMKKNFPDYFKFKGEEIASGDKSLTDLKKKAKQLLKTLGQPTIPDPLTPSRDPQVGVRRDGAIDEIKGDPRNMNVKIGKGDYSLEDLANRRGFSSISREAEESGSEEDQINILKELERIGGEKESSTKQMKKLSFFRKMLKDLGE